MKKVSTAAAEQIRNCSEHTMKLTIGLDLGDRSSWYCVLNEAGSVLLEQTTEHNSESHEGCVRSHAAQPGSRWKRGCTRRGRAGRRATWGMK